MTGKNVALGDLFQFEWRRDPAGYRIERRIARASDVLLHNVPRAGITIEIIKPRSGETEVCYPLLDSPNLAREFAALDSEDDVLAFTGRYGLLRRVERASLSLPEFWAAQRQVSAVFDFGLNPASNYAEYRRLVDRFNGSISSEAVLNVRLGFEQDAQGRTKFHRRVLRVVPASLLSAMWLLVAQEIAGEVQWAECPTCGKRFLKGAGRGRGVRAEYCSETCAKEARRPKPKTKKRDTCAYCGEPLPAESGVRRMYCSDAHKVAAKRKRDRAKPPKHK